MSWPALESLPEIPRDERVSLGEREVHLWYTPFNEDWDPDLLARYRAIMTAAERERMDRFVFQRDQVQFAITRALVRGALSRYAAARPADWRFVENDHGKPAIEPRTSTAVSSGVADQAQGLYFNLSNTRGLVVCAITRMAPEIGVDTERIDRSTALLDIADRYFSPSEVADLRAHPEREQRARFFVYWTLKESYIKARGLGLALPLEQFSFHVPVPPRTGTDRAITISFDPGLDDRPDTWTFWLGRAAASHHVAVAVRTHDAPGMELSARSWVPLRER